MALESALNPFMIGSYIIPTWLLWVATIWDLAWRALAVWKSTIQKQPGWSVAFVLFQTLGILPILYIFVFSKIKKSLADEKVVAKKTSKKRK